MAFPVFIINARQLIFVGGASYISRALGRKDIGARRGASFHVLHRLRCFNGYTGVHEPSTAADVHRTTEQTMPLTKTIYHM